MVIVGDSLTGGNASYIAPALRSAGLDARVEGLSYGDLDEHLARTGHLLAEGILDANDTDESEPRLDRLGQ